MENRRAKRIDANLKIMMEPLNKSGEQESFEVEVMNVSKEGLGFVASNPLETHSFYKAHLVFQSKESVEAVIEIVRHIENDQHPYMYGSRFVGLTEGERFKIEVFRLFTENERNSVEI